MIVVTLGSIYNAKEIFGKMANCAFSAVTAYRISKILRQLEDELTSYFMAQGQIAEKYGKRDESGNLINNADGVPICPQYADAFKTEMQELNSLAIEIRAEPISASELAPLQLTPKEIILLDNFIVE